MNFKKIIIIFLVSIIAIVGIIVLLALLGSKQFSYDKSNKSIEKVRVAEEYSASTDLNEDELNSVIGNFLSKDKSTNISSLVKGLHVSIKDGNLIFMVPVKYKVINFLLTTGGKCSYIKDENKVLFTPNFYKIGKLPLPKNLVNNIIHKYGKDKLEFKGSSIKVSLSDFPFTITAAAFNKESVTLSFKRYTAESLFPSLSQSSDNKNSTIDTQQSKNTSQETSKTAQGSNNKSTDSSNTSSSSSKTSEGSSTASANSGTTNSNPKQNEDAKSSADTKSNLSQISGQLSGAAGSLTTSSEQDIISRMISTINAVNANPSYNYSADVSSVLNSYLSLPDDQRNTVKNAILSSVDYATAMKLRATFGM